MEFHLLHILTFLLVAVVASHAAILQPQVYWNSVLPKTPMPKVVKDLLHSEWMEEKDTSVDVGKGGVGVDVEKGNTGGQGVGVDGGKPGGGGTDVDVGKGGVNVNTGKKGHPVYVGVNRGPNPFLYNYAATEDQLHDNPNAALFFLEKNIQKGTTLNLHLMKTTNAAATLLPRQVSDSIPFSSNMLPEILNRFSVKPNSVEAEIMKKTIKECEEPGIKGESKFCATSLESMIDFSTSNLGKKVKAISTEVEKETQMQKYHIERVRKMEGDDAVVCHKQNYVYAVFYCHKTATTRAYMVSMVGDNGSKAKAVAVCHTDTSAWNPKHLAFQVLKVKPGTVPICHFLPEDHIVWIPN